MKTAEQKKIDQLFAMWDKLKNERSPHEEMWKSITRFCSPDQDFWSNVKENAEGPSNHVFDGTPMSAVTIMANALQGYMASKVTKSFSVGIESYRTLPFMPFEGRVRRYVQDLDDALTWMINHSNFYDSVNEMFRLGGVIGTAVVYADKVPGEDRIVNLISHPNDVWISENSSEVVDTVFRRVWMSMREVIDRWGGDAELQRLAEADPFKQYEILHIVLPRSVRDATKIDNTNKPYASYWVDVTKRKLLHESGFDVFPYMVWRWSTPNSSVYGWGPSHNAMAEILRINRLSKTMTDAAQLSVFPALNVPTESIRQVNLNPRGMNAYVDPSRMITPIQQVGNYPIGRDREQAIELAIRQHYMVDMFLMMNQYADTNKTATEVLEMQAEKAAVMGAITSRIEGELFDRLFNRYFEIGTMNGWLPPPPPEAFEMLNGAELKIDYIGPMAQMQQRFYQKQSIDAPLERILTYAQMLPELLDAIDATELGIRMVAESSLPEDIVRPRAEIKKIQEARAKMMQEQAMADINMKQAKAAKDSEGGDLLEEMYGG